MLAALVLPLLASCRSVGQYAGDRGLDFLDQYRIAVGAGTVIGARAKAGGLWDTGLMVGVKPKATALGWRYGSPLFFNQNDVRVDANQAQVIMTTNMVGMDIGTGAYNSAWNSFAILPAVFTQADATPDDFEWEVPPEGEDFVTQSWLWSKRNFKNNRYAQIHAFDVEAEVGLFVYIDAGFSLGEAVDFWLGLLTIDIAKDDNRF